MKRNSLVNLWWVFVSYWLIFAGYLCEKNVACAQRTLDGHCCRFPFYYKKTKYKRCTSHGDVNNRFWCATDYKYDRNDTAGWGYCKCKTLLTPRGGRYSLEFLVRVCMLRGSPSLDPISDQKMSFFSHPFPDLVSKIHNHFQTWSLRNYVMIT